MNTQGNTLQSGVINTATSDQIQRKYYNKQKEITFRSLKNYWADVYKEIETSERLPFSNYKTLIILALHIVILSARAAVLLTP